MWLKFERAFSLFVSSAKCSSPDQHKTRSLLAINAFACRVISCSEVNSRGYLVASDDAFVCSVISYLEVKRAVFENWFTNPLPHPKKEQKLYHVRVELSIHDTLITHELRTLPTPNLQNRLLSTTRRSH